MINKGVKNIYEDIIQRFIRDFNRRYCFSLSFKEVKYEELRAMKMIVIENDNGKSDPGLDLLHLTDPLSQESKDFIDEAKVFTLDKIDRIDQNAVNFGLARLTLTLCVNLLMFEIVVSLQINQEMPTELTCLLEELSDIITKLFFESSSGYVYVDHLALKSWEVEKCEKVKSKYQEYEKCQHDVWKMLENIVKKQEKQVGQEPVEKKPLVVYWGMWAFLVYQALPKIN